MEYDICKILGNNVKKYRKLKGYSQEKFAELIEIGVTSLSLIERGKGFVSAPTLEKISAVLKIPVNILMSGEEETENSLFEEVEMRIDNIKNDKRKLKLLNEYLKILM